MLYCTWSWCGIVAWWCAVLGLVTGLAAAWAWAWSTRVPLDPLEGNPSGMLPVDRDVADLAWRLARGGLAAERSRWTTQPGRGAAHRGGRGAELGGLAAEPGAADVWQDVVVP